MTMKFQDAAGSHAGKGICRDCGPKNSENFCGIFDALCYIPALLTNRN
jgi:hypothetical protein